MKSRIKEQGSAAHIVIIIVLVLAVLGLLGYVFWQNFASKWAGQAETSQEVVKNEKLPETYTSDFGRYTVNYPSDWTIETEYTAATDYRVAIESTSFTSPDGTVLGFGVNTAGDRGGTGCQEEVPFEVGNQCPSWEYLSAEKLPITNVYGMVTTPGTPSGTTEQLDMYLVTAKYGETDGTVTYLVGVIGDNSYFPIGENIKQPKTGIYYPDLTFSHVDKDYKDTRIYHPGLSLYASSESGDFLDSADVGTIKEILRTLTIK